MPFVALIVGVILVVVAFNNSAGALVTELEQDVQGYFKWAAAITAILALGYIPGLRTPSRWLLGLVALVVVLTQWSNIQAGFSAFTSNPGSASGQGQAQPTPTQSYTQTNAPAAAATSGTSTASATAPATAASLIAANPLSPSSYLQAAGIAGGFGGIV